MLNKLARVPAIVWVLLVIALLGCCWGAWTHYQANTNDPKWLDPQQPPAGIIVPPVTFVGLGGGGTSHGSGHSSPVMCKRSYPASLAAWENSWIRPNFTTPGVI